MHISVEPQNGHPLDRLITALLNATGTVHRVIDCTAHPVGADGAEVIGLIAERLRRVLALLAEHNSDEELELVTRVLAETTLLVADELELGGLLRRG